MNGRTHISLNSLPFVGECLSQLREEDDGPHYFRGSLILLDAKSYKINTCEGKKDCPYRNQQDKVVEFIIRPHRFLE
ncbi:hypothetical protein CEXT_243771 [Caerostris extrusa]|uniref:Uncharacterized protein n=1 Tax=Caerostris extrusa TaxID=172846 RepID=A0AAV4NYE8_CAEEX|nr:hypothetical protein CEXT_243771 [Caerostris extrusa]